MYHIATIVVTRRTAATSAAILALPVRLTTKGQAKIPFRLANTLPKKFAGAAGDETADWPASVNSATGGSHANAEKNSTKF
jgi:hypothetical protein